jgi:hypothetical protein
MTTGGMMCPRLFRCRQSVPGTRERAAAVETSALFSEGEAIMTS